LKSTESVVSILVGHKVTAIDRHEFSWSVTFESVATVTMECPWRILSADRIALSNSDDGQKFGLSEPKDALVVARCLILGKTVHRVAVREHTGDLTIAFGEGLAPEAFNMSSGYEAWQLSTPEGVTLITTGGGKIELA
jgi:hypothetical protein